MPANTNYTESRTLNDDWNATWVKRSISDEIKMKDFFRGREFITKYTPRQGKSIEAGCGLGRYVFYLSDLGIDIVGLDVSETSLQKCKKWAEEHNYPKEIFQHGDIRTLQYPDNFFSGYISLGVVEHFEEGPEQALIEAFRVMKGGGVAIIETPNKYSIEFIIMRILNPIKLMVKRALPGINSKSKTKESPPNVFFQYEFSGNELAHFMENAGFIIVEKKQIDLKYPVYELCQTLPLFRNKWVKIFEKLVKPYVFPVLDILENTPLSFFGGLSMVIAYKPSSNMHCFFCDQTLDGAIFNNEFQLPICQCCLTDIPSEILNTYKKGKKIVFGGLTPQDVNSHKNDVESCFFCNQEVYRTNPFENYGFTVPVCNTCIKEPTNNLILSNFYFNHEWRDYFGN